MRKLIVLALVGLVGALMATPVAATTTRIPTACQETLQGDWTGGREWVDENLVYHSRGATAIYEDVGDPYCAGTSEVTVAVNLDLLTGEGTVTATAHVTLDAFDGGWDGLLVAHFTPGGASIWVGRVVGNGFGELAGWQWRSNLVEVTHQLIVEDGLVFDPGS